MKRFFQFWSKQHVFVNLSAFVVLVWGGYVALTVTKEAFPQFDFDVVFVQTVYPGATPEEVESLVTIPLEREIKTVDGIDEMNSISIEGRSTIVLQLDPDASNKAKVVKDIENAVDRVRVSELPENGDEPLVTELTTSNRPVLNVAVSGTLSDDELRSLARHMRDDFLDIKGVGQVSMQGYREKEIWVEGDLNKMAAYDLSLSDLIRSISAANHTSAGGTLERGPREILVRTMGKLETEDDVKQVVVRSNSDGSRVLVKYVANVSERLERERNYTRVNGRKAINLVIGKKPSGDSLKIAHQVKKKVDDWKKRYPGQITVAYSDDTTFYIKRRLNILIRNGVQGLILVLLTLFIFLSPSSAFWTAAAIPFAFLGGLLMMTFAGMTVNLITLFAFVLVSGMLVDDGIVVTEFYERKRAEGLSPKEAAIEATSQMSLPITAAVCTTIVAFLPLAFVTGLIGKFLRQMPLVLIFTLVADLLEVLFVLPSHLALTAGRFRTPRAIEALRNFGTRLMSRIEKLYKPKGITDMTMNGCPKD